METKPVQPYFDVLITAIQDQGLSTPAQVAVLASMMIEQELKNQKRIIRYNIIKKIVKEGAELDLDKVHEELDSLLDVRG